MFIHILNEKGDLVQQSDAFPVHWTYPTTHWQPKEYVSDVHEIVAETSLPPDKYTVKAGWYLEKTGERLPVWQNNTYSPEHSITLTRELEFGLCSLNLRNE